MNTPDAEKAFCLKTAAAIAARHASPAALDAATADIARELEKARAGALTESFAKAGSGFEKETFDGAQRCLQKACVNMTMLGDSRTALGLMAIGLLVKTISDAVHGPAPAAGWPAPAGASKQ